METDDKFLSEYRRDPTPGYSRRLREQLREEEETQHAPRWRPMLAAAAALAVVTSLFAFPAVRAGAQAVLDMFRVRNFVAVSFDAKRVEKLRSLDNDNAMMIFDRHEVIQDPGKPVFHASPGTASAAAGFTVETPAFLPAGFSPDTVAVTGEARARLGVSSGRLRGLLDALDLRDVQVPAGLDGQDFAVHLYPVVNQRFRSSRSKLDLIQSRSPEVSLPTGVDMARLGEIGLRILGLDAGEARRIASSVDWRGTLLVPVPTNVSSFRQVTVQGTPGLLITTTRTDSEGRRREGGSVVLWTEDDRVFALQGTLEGRDLLQIADSVR